MRTLLIVLLIICTGCRSSQKTIETVIQKQKEYVYREKKDTLFMFEPAPEKSQNEQIVIKDSTYTSYVETSLAFSNAVFEEGKLTHYIKNKSNIPIQVPNALEIIHKTDTLYTFVNVDNIVEKEKYRFANQFFYTAGVLSSILFIIVIILYIFKTKSEWIQ